MENIQKFLLHYISNTKITKDHGSQLTYLRLYPVDDLATDGDGNVELDVWSLVVAATPQHVLVTEQKNSVRNTFTIIS